MTRKLQKSTDFRIRLRKAIRAAGEWIRDNADDMVPEIDGLKSYTIRIDFDSEDGCPIINFDADYISMDMINAMFEKSED